MFEDFGRYVALAAAVAFGLAGCASRGNEVLKTQDTSTVNLTVIDGQTTRDEIQRIYGPPAQTSFLSEKNEVWTYRWQRATAQGQNFIPIVGAFVRGYDVRKKELVIVFNERNVVARHTMTDNNDAIKTGFMDSGPASPLSDSPVSSTTALPPAATPSPATSAVSAKPAAATAPASPSAPVPSDPTVGLNRSRL
jgi:hypothetical protein